jgi:hypothetical protein
MRCIDANLCGFLDLRGTQPSGYQIDTPTLNPCRVTMYSVTIRSGNPASARKADGVQYRVLSVRAIASWAAIVVLVGVGVAVWLLLAYGGGNAAADQAHLDAIRTAGTIVVGSGGAVALLLAARRQRSTEIALRHQERATATSEHDATERRITDLYTKAVEQLGSDKAPVRLGGLYALERLADDNAGHRQTIVNMLCAYLRMPFELPKDPPEDASTDRLKEHRDQERELQVRLAAQHLLVAHLQPGEDPDNPIERFWADIELDLTGAVLLNFSLSQCAVRAADFRWATFEGHASFWASTFNGTAAFSGATFTSHASFGPTTFSGMANFVRAKIAGNANFESTTFSGNANFRSTTVSGAAKFGLATLPDRRYAGNETPEPWTSVEGARFEQGIPRELSPFLSSPDEASRTPTKPR